MQATWGFYERLPEDLKDLFLDVLELAEANHELKLKLLAEEGA